jgi:ABC-type Fe3+ transport system permease subunit
VYEFVSPSQKRQDLEEQARQHATRAFITTTTLPYAVNPDTIALGGLSPFRNIFGGISY